MVNEKEFSDYKEKLNEILEIITVPELKTVLETILFDKYKPKILKNRIKDIETVEFGLEFLKARKLYNPLYSNKQVDTAIAAILLHRVFNDDKSITINNWKNVFNAREKMKPIVAEHLNSGNYEMFEYIYQIIEAQLGEEMPIPACRPVIGQVTYIVWEILWFSENHLK